MFLEHIGSIAPDVAFHDVMKKEYENPQNGASAHKHILQQVGRNWIIAECSVVVKMLCIVVVLNC